MVDVTRFWINKKAVDGIWMGGEIIDKNCDGDGVEVGVVKRCEVIEG